MSDGIKEIIRYLKNIDANTGKQISNTVRLFGLDLWNVAKERSPVDAGTYRGDWIQNFTKPAGTFGQVSLTNSMSYAEPLDLGSPVGGKPWPGVGPKTMKRGSRIFSLQAPEGVSVPLMDEKNPENMIDEFNEKIDKVLDGILK